MEETHSDPLCNDYECIVNQSLRPTYGSHIASSIFPAGKRAWVLPGCSLWVQESYIADGAVMLGLHAQYAPGHAAVRGSLSISTASWLVLFCYSSSLPSL